MYNVVVVCLYDFIWQIFHPPENKTVETGNFVACCFSPHPRPEEMHWCIDLFWQKAKVMWEEFICHLSYFVCISFKAILKNTLDLGYHLLAFAFTLW